MSLILIAAGLAQIATAWFKSYALPQSLLSQPQSSLIANRFYFDYLLQYLINIFGSGETSGPRVEYIFCLLIALLSCVPVYFAARRWFGAYWALLAGLIYVLHPGFAWFVADTGPLALLVFLVPVTWLLLLRWENQQGPAEALFLGAGLAVMYLINFVGLVLLLLMTLGVLMQRLQRRRPRWELIGAMLMMVGYASLVVPARGLLSAADRTESETTMTTDFWHAIDNGDGSAIARAARQTKSSPRPLLFLRDQAWESPSNVAGWVLRRAWRTLYLSSDDSFSQVLFFLQLAWLVPAVWGLIVSLRSPERRWAAALGGGMVFCLWGMAAVVEPLARNLTPLLWIVMIFALAGIRDVYTRIAMRPSPSPAASIKLSRRWIDP